MESINLANHIVSIKVDDSINHVVDRSELFDILSNVPTKTIVDNVGQVVSSIIDIAPVEIVVIDVVFHIDVST